MPAQSEVDSKRQQGAIPKQSNRVARGESGNGEQQGTNEVQQVTVARPTKKRLATATRTRRERAAAAAAAAAAASGSSVSSEL